LPDTSPGPDEILPQFVKSLPKLWINVLLELINGIWREGKFPDVWKYGEAVMLPKPGKDLSKIENYRYITLLPVLGKVMERMVKKRLEAVTQQKKILKDIQCGFRKNRSAEDSLMCLKQEALYALQNGWILAAILIDIEGAFDNMLHRKMVGGLVTAGIKGQMLAFLNDYLIGRKVKVRVGRTISNITVISSRLEFNMDQDTPADLAFCMMMEKEYKGYLPLFTDGSKVDEMKHVKVTDSVLDPVGLSEPGVEPLDDLQASRTAG
ncbi:hypothetical protein QYM36_014071, partial [Artemia franciscana]